MKELHKSNSSYGRWVVFYPGKHTIEQKFFWNKKEALEFLSS